LYVPQAVTQASFLPYIYRKGGRSGASYTCRTCRGCGIKITYRQLGPGMSQQLQSRCPDCRGEGEVTCSHTALQLQEYFVLVTVAFI
jgi:predicted  nucleic acid-binding Zn ribbon protein